MPGLCFNAYSLFSWNWYRLSTLDRFQAYVILKCFPFQKYRQYDQQAAFARIVEMDMNFCFPKYEIRIRYDFDMWAFITTRSISQFREKRSYVILQRLATAL